MTEPDSNGDAMREFMGVDAYWDVYKSIKEVLSGRLYKSD